jgi:DNA-binding IclR family transcriptional regulator
VAGASIAGGCAERAAEGSRSVLARAAAIVGAFAGAPPVLSLKELTVRTGMPKSTVHRFAEQLLELGWLERDVHGYRIGVRLFEVGGLAERRNRVRDRAAPHLHRLAAATGLTVHLGILDEGDVVYLDRVPVEGVKLPLHDGARMPAHCTGLGKALLAHADDAAVEGVLAAGLVRRTRRTVVDPAAWRAELATIRSTGIAHDREECYDGIVCVAAPVRGAGRAIGAISVVGTPGHPGLARAEQLVRRTAAVVWGELFDAPGAGRRRAAPVVA